MLLVCRIRSHGYKHKKRKHSHSPRHSQDNQAGDKSAQVSDLSIRLHPLETIHRSPLLSPLRHLRSIEKQGWRTIFFKRNSCRRLRGSTGLPRELCSVAFKQGVAAQRHAPTCSPPRLQQPPPDVHWPPVSRLLMTPPSRRIDNPQLICPKCRENGRLSQRSWTELQPNSCYGRGPYTRIGDQIGF